MAHATSADLEMVLAGVEFPASRDDLLEAADEMQVDEELVVAIEGTPQDYFDTREEAARAISDTRDMQEYDG